MAQEERPKDPGVVAVLNLVVPGAGYIYSGRLGWGVVSLAVALFAGYSLLTGFNVWTFYIGWGIGCAIGGYLDQRKAIRAFDAARSAASRPCPFCAESIKVEARVCRFCQRDIPAAA